MKKSSTTVAETKPVHRTAKEKRQGAERTARWRERKAAELVDVRALDKVISEALAIYVRDLPEDRQRALLAPIVDLAVAGLRFQGHEASVARNRVVDRMEMWVGSAPSSGSVRAALDRKQLRLKGSPVTT